MIFFYLLAGTIGVINMVLWGLYGDLLVEKFELSKILRSLFFGIVYSIFLFFVDSRLPLFVVALIVITMERTTTEIYKALIRNESQEKYDIPSDLNLKGSRAAKRVIGYLLIAILLALFYVVDLRVPNVILLVFISIIPAIGGAAKDAPYEGFSPVKFLRTPVVSLAVGVFLIWVFPNLDPKFFLVAVPGGERIISECYKKIIRNKIPGKFKQSLRINEIWRQKRQKLLFAYALNILALFCILVFKP